MASTLQNYASLIQDPLRRGLVDILWKSSRLMTRLHWINWEGVSYPYSKRVKRPGVATRGINSAFAITPGQYAPDIETLAILGGKSQTDTMFLKIKPTLRENEIMGTMEATGLMMDRLIVKGNPTISGKPNDFYGLYSRINSTTGLITNSANGGAVAMAKVDALLTSVIGPDSQKELWMNRTTRDNFYLAWRLGATGARLSDVGDRPPDYRGAKIVTVEKDETDTEIMPFTEVCGSSGAACSSILCIRPGQERDEVDVQGILSADLQVSPPINFGEYVQDTIQMWGGIGVFGGYSISQLQGITATPPASAS